MPVIQQDLADRLEKAFKSLKGEVRLEVYTGPGANEEFAEFSRGFARELSELSDKISADLYPLGSPQARQKGIERSPTLLVAPDRYRLRFTGAPAGEEARSLLETIFMVSAGRSRLTDASRRRLATELEGKRRIKVFVSPTCPYCPDQVLQAFGAAIEQPDKIEVEVIDILENQDLAEKEGATSVPQTVFDGKLTTLGLEPEEMFIEELLSLKEVREVAAAEPGEEVETDLVVLGAGPAGLTAAIYAARSGLGVFVVDKGSLGGQVAATPVVENYPGFSRVAGKALVDMMVSQAMGYVKIHQNEQLQYIARLGDGRLEVETSRRKYRCRGLILATGAAYRRLDVPGDQRFYGHGVSYCATCDGYFYRNKKVLMVGGGNSALTEALYLDTLGAKVSLVHRRDKLRAEKRLQESLEARKIPVLWNTELRAVVGEERVEAAELENTAEGRRWREPVDGVFISIGYVPANEPAKMLGLELDQDGYVVVDHDQRTSMPVVFAAGDLTGGIKQITTAVGQGAVAALTAFHDLERAGRPQQAAGPA